MGACLNSHDGPSQCSDARGGAGGVVGVDVIVGGQPCVPTDIKPADAGPADIKPRPIPDSGLHVASADGDLDRVRRLLACGAGVNSVLPSDGGNAPLHHAARMGRLEVVRALVEASADVGLKNSCGYTAFAVARDWSPSMEVVDFLNSVTHEQTPGIMWDR
mmetsp:Transcript_1545/g.5275  ORF Transcript_1545/g.5275 Transcript_1545/m.5275 type:complete len:161 (-) Transcript_1545:114-596(-)